MTNAKYESFRTCFHPQVPGALFGPKKKDSTYFKILLYINKPENIAKKKKSKIRILLSLKDQNNVPGWCGFTQD